MSNADHIQACFQNIQDHICAFLTGEDGTPCREDRWDYASGTGGGITRVWENSVLLEKAGVNYSAIQGLNLPRSAATQFQIPEGAPFTATGVSLVIHPQNPFIPTVHMNVRYFEAGERWWFGGGVDLTPYYPVHGEIVQFHRALKALCDKYEEDYVTHKKACDDYFFIRHRNETRGVGGLFFDHLCADPEKHTAFVMALGTAFPDLYCPFIRAHRDRPFTPAQREFQCYRRSRYVEFNLVYDRGTLFGLQSGGRIESILMSMPAVAAWRYNWTPEPGSPEAELTEYYLKPRNWLAE